MISLKLQTSNVKSPKYDDLISSKSDIPVPSNSHILVKVHSCALNHRDIFIRQGLYPRITTNSILGSDCSGTIASSSSKYPIGTPVILNPSVGWVSDPVKPEDPSTFGILGLLPFPGTFAEYILVPESQIFPKPAHLSFVEAAALPLAGLTAYRAVFTKGNVTKKSRVLITGIGGGVALYALLFCVSVGATVIVTSSDDKKITKAISLGAKFGVNYKTGAINLI